MTNPHLVWRVAVGAICLTIGSAGGAVAGAAITGAQIKDGSVTGKDVKDRSLATKDMSTKTLEPFRQGGPQGPEGATGPHGTLDHVQVTGTPSSSQITYVECPDGYRVLSGGGRMINGSSFLWSSHPEVLPNFDRWVVAFTQAPPPGGSIVATATCVRY